MGTLSKTGRYATSAPSQAVFNGKHCIAWSDQNTKSLKVCYYSASSSSWVDFSDTGQTSGISPCITVFNGKLYMAYVDGSNVIQLIYTSDGNSWSQPSPTGKSSKRGPAICSFQGKLFLAWSNAKNDNIFVTSSVDATNWGGSVTDTGRNTSWAPSICAFKNTLFITWTGINTKKVKIISSTDGSNWTKFIETGQLSNSNPSIAMADNVLVIGFKAKSSNNLLMITSSDGKKWSNNSKVEMTSPYGPGITYTNGHMYWVYVEGDGNSHEIYFGTSGAIDYGTGESIPLYVDTTENKLIFNLYYDFNMNNPLQINPDTGSTNFTLQAADMKVGVDASLSHCKDNTSCNWGNINYTNNYVGGSVPLNANALPPSSTSKNVCGWNCAIAGGDHSRLTRYSTLPTICVSNSSIGFPNVLCGVIGFGYNEKTSPPANWSQFGLGYPGSDISAFLTQVKYTTFHIAVDKEVYTSKGTSQAGFWGLNLPITSGTSQLLQVPFYVNGSSPDKKAGTRQIKLGISADGVSQATLYPVNLDTGMANKYRLNQGGELCNEIANYFRQLANSKNDQVSLDSINKWASTKGSNLMVKTSLLLDDSGNYITLPFQFEQTASQAMFTKDYYLYYDFKDMSVLYFFTDSKDTFGLPFFLDRQLVFNDDPTDGKSFTATIYNY